MGSEPELRDGRVLRGVRSREAIVGALFDLVGEGMLRPTAQEVAERADVNIRTVFRHFSEIDHLYGAMDTRLHREVRALHDIEPAPGTLEERVEDLVRQRCVVFEKVAPYERSAKLQRWRSPFLSAARKYAVKELRDYMLLWVPELKSCPTELRNAAEVLMSFESWDRLRVDQGLSRPATRSALNSGLLAIIEAGQGRA